MSYVGKAFLVDAIVRRLPMLKTLATSNVREREQEVVLVVVMRGIQSISLPNEIGNLGKQCWTEVGVFRRVGNNIDIVLWRDLGGERKLVEVLPCNHWRVFQLLDIGGGKMCCASSSRNWIGTRPGRHKR